MKKTNILLLIVIFLINCSNKEQSLSNQNDSNIVGYNSYALALPIKESCDNIIFSDSLWRKWNYTSCIYLENEIKKTQNKCLNVPYEQFKKGENYRLELAKAINRLELLTENDLKEEFYIVEVLRSGSKQRYDSYIFSKNVNLFNSKYLRFSDKDTTWILMKEFTVNKEEFTDFYNNLRKNNKNDSNINIDIFNVTKFTSDRIECYLSYCKYCNKCIKEFNNLVDY